jgi:thiol-disulfide isomerase/thioredoxin
MVTRRFLMTFAVAAAVSLGGSSAFGQTVPRPADPLIINSLNGAAPMDLAKMKGKVVAVELLLTWCEHCQNSAKVLQALSAELGSKGFSVIGAATDVDAKNAQEKVNAFLGITGAKFPVGWVTQPQTYAFLNHPMAKGLYFPQLVLVDRKGNVRWQHTGEISPAELKTEVQKLLDEPAGAAGAKKAAAPAKKS